MDAVPATATTLRRAQAHGLILLLDHWRTAPSARNAQIAPLVPPHQAEDFRDALSAFTPPGMAEWAEAARRRSALARTSLPPACATTASMQTRAPSCRCRSAPPTPAMPTPGAAVWQRALAARPCADEYRP